MSMCFDFDELRLFLEYNCETREKRIIYIYIYIFFSFSENKRIGDSCRDGTNKTLDFSRPQMKKQIKPLESSREIW